jgi:hypothetical protein
LEATWLAWRHATDGYRAAVTHVQTYSLAAARAAALNLA